MIDNASTFYDIIERFAKDYHVPDILLPTSRCIFVLESPHIQEVKYGAPVAGNSGATMSKHIFGPEYARFPLGRMVKKNADELTNRPRLNGIGLVNVCNIPLQRAAYKGLTVTPELAGWFADMEAVRTGNQKDTFPNERQNDIQACLTALLHEKLSRFKGQAITLVPCGRFAQKFVRLTGVHDPNWEIIREVPHPSYNSWDRERYRNEVAKVQQAVASAAALLPQ